ncbi:MAG: hypothetical protein OIF50_17085 [Flavobacteriaceae bacterium]|nr:hypothetical protein [Flavobacteriaceae bacterium]
MGEVIKKSIEAHGGDSLWKQTKSLQFMKETTLYLENGTKEKQQIEFQYFQILPEFIIRLQQMESNGAKTTSILFPNGQFEMQRDSIKTKMKAPQSFVDRAHGSFFVASQPFNLLNSEADFRLGKDTTIQKRPAYAVEVRYPKGDPWIFYIDKENYRVLANLVKHDKTRSFILNEAYDHSTGILLHRKRKSYFLDSLHQIKYLRASYHYYNYQIKRN